MTNKGGAGPPRFRNAVARRLAREWKAGLRQAGARGVIVHGAGSFGHPLAVQYGVGRRRLRGQERDRAVERIRAQVETLQSRVTQTLLETRVVAAPLPAHQRRAGSWPAVVRRMVADGVTPVTGGDILLDGRMGARILSGDEILYHLARGLRPRRVVFATDVDGLVLDGRLILELPPAAARRALGVVPRGGDATGGFRGKLGWASRIQRLGVEVVIVNGRVPGRFRDAVSGKRLPGTRLPAR